MEVIQIVTASAAGALVGFILGLIGGGGSILATPLLLYVVGVTPPHMAIGTGALAVSVNAYANVVAHARRGNVRWREAAVFAVVGALGALAGSSLGKATDGQALLFLFGLVMVAVGLSMLRPRRERAADSPAATPATLARLGALAALVGGAAGFFGIGGGFLVVPALLAATGMSVANAVGSSLLAVGTFGLATAINYALSGWVDWGVAALFIAGGVGGGRLGTGLSLRLGRQRNTLARIFAGVVFVVAAYVLHRSAGALLG